MAAGSMHNMGVVLECSSSLAKVKISILVDHFHGLFLSRVCTLLLTCNKECIHYFELTGSSVA